MPAKRANQSTSNPRKRPKTDKGKAKEVTSEPQQGRTLLHPLALIESLPNELINMIDAEANNPWLAYASPVLHDCLETPQNRKRYVELAFEIFGNGVGILPAAHFVTYLDYAAFFQVFASLPWFANAVFKKSRRLITGTALCKWIRTSHGAFACLAVTAWNQALGDFTSLALSKYLLSIGCRRDYVRQAVLAGFEAAFTDRSIPGIELLSGLQFPVALSEAATAERRAETAAPKFERWIQPWRRQNIAFPPGPRLQEASRIEIWIGCALMSRYGDSAVARELARQFWEAWFAEGRTFAIEYRRHNWRTLETMRDLLRYIGRFRAQLDDDGFYECLEDAVVDQFLAMPRGLYLNDTSDYADLARIAADWSGFDMLQRRGVYSRKEDFDADMRREVRFTTDFKKYLRSQNADGTNMKEDKNWRDLAV